VLTRSDGRDFRPDRLIGQAECSCAKSYTPDQTDETSVPRVKTSQMPEVRHVQQAFPDFRSTFAYRSLERSIGGTGSKDRIVGDALTP
jgi:hypothetical protein